MPEMNCSPQCIYFIANNISSEDWEVDSNGLKIRKDKAGFICAYDNHTIKSWYDDCPRNGCLLKKNNNLFDLKNGDESND